MSKLNSLEDLGKLWNEEHPEDKIDLNPPKKCNSCGVTEKKVKGIKTLRQYFDSNKITLNVFNYAKDKHGYTNDTTFCSKCISMFNNEQDNRPWYQKEGEELLLKMTDEERAAAKEHAQAVMDFITKYSEENILFIPALLKARAGKRSTEFSKGSITDMLVIGDISMKMQEKFHIDPFTATIYLKAFADGLIDTLGGKVIN